VKTLRYSGKKLVFSGGTTPCPKISDTPTDKLV